ncbi:MAG: DUF3592 domain-containing protein [Candidatus Omnitrophica bacterium]|nr:DUF3592 domain-containing protein [Candidatus Omnitrophota bacterium]
MESRPNPISARAGVLACYALALLCLAGGGYRTRQLTTLANDGVTVAAVVDGIHRGTKGLKSAELRFTTREGEEITARDILPMMIFRFRKGDSVRVIYHPPDPRLVTVDLGRWIWLQPVVFFAGAVLLTVLAIVMPRRPAPPVKN